MSFSFGGGASTGSSGFSFGGGAKPPATNAPATGSLGGFGFGGATSTTTAGAAPTFGGFGTTVIELLLALRQSFSVSIAGSNFNRPQYWFWHWDWRIQLWWVSQTCGSHGYSHSFTGRIWWSCFYNALHGWRIWWSCHTHNYAFPRRPCWICFYHSFPRRIRCSCFYHAFFGRIWWSDYNHAFFGRVWWSHGQDHYRRSTGIWNSGSSFL